MSLTRIPAAPLFLGLSGLIPFLWGAATSLWPLTFNNALMTTFTGQSVLGLYGLTILAFMSGTIWGFATRSGQEPAAWGYALSVLPALWGFFAFAMTERGTCAALALGLVLLLPLDLRAIRLGEAPGWWLSLRLILTTIAVASLLVGALA